MGFDPKFLSECVIPLPELSAQVRETALNDGAAIEHSRFTLVFNEQRGFAIVTAHNIDGASIIPEGVIPNRRRFRFDPKVPRDLQVDNERGYLRNPYDRGHLVQRRALHWATLTPPR